MECTEIGRIYRVELPQLQFTRLLRKDEEQWLAGEKDLGEILSALSGVSAVEYNSHFGPAVFFRLSSDPEDAPVTTKDVMRAIRRYVDA